VRGRGAGREVDGCLRDHRVACGECRGDVVMARAGFALPKQLRKVGGIYRAAAVQLGSVTPRRDLQVMDGGEPLAADVVEWSDGADVWAAVERLVLGATSVGSGAATVDAGGSGGASVGAEAV